MSERESLNPSRHLLAGYARRNGIMGDVHRMNSKRVSGITHGGKPFSWLRGPDVELFEFGSFNPENENYMAGGRPWGGSGE